MKTSPTDGRVPWPVIDAIPLHSGPIGRFQPGHQLARSLVYTPVPAGRHTLCPSLWRKPVRLQSLPSFKRANTVRMDRVDDGRPGDVITDADAERWRLCLVIAERWMATPEGVVSITRISDRAAALSAARVLYRGDVPTESA
jgi:hypothetical protein